MWVAGNIWMKCTGHCRCRKKYFRINIEKCATKLAEHYHHCMVFCWLTGPLCHCCHQLTQSCSLVALYPKHLLSSVVNLFSFLFPLFCQEQLLYFFFSDNVSYPASILLQDYFQKCSNFLHSGFLINQ